MNSPHTTPVMSAIKRNTGVHPRERANPAFADIPAEVDHMSAPADVQVEEGEDTTQRVEVDVGNRENYSQVYVPFHRTIVPADTEARTLTIKLANPADTFPAVMLDSKAKPVLDVNGQYTSAQHIGKAETQGASSTYPVPLSVKLLGFGAPGEVSKTSTAGCEGAVESTTQYLLGHGSTVHTEKLYRRHIQRNEECRAMANMTREHLRADMRPYTSMNFWQVRIPEVAVHTHNIYGGELYKACIHSLEQEATEAGTDPVYPSADDGEFALFKRHIVDGVLENYDERVGDANLTTDPSEIRLEITRVDGRAFSDPANTGLGVGEADRVFAQPAFLNLNVMFSYLTPQFVPVEPTPKEESDVEAF